MNGETQESVSIGQTQLEQAIQSVSDGQSENTQEPDNYNPADICALSGGKAYYGEQYKKMKKMQSAVSWNCPAFLLTVPWLLYRRMYAYALAAAVLTILVVIVPYGFYATLLLAFKMGFGLYANAVYFMRLERVAARIKTLPQDKQAAEFQNRGGTSPFLAFAGTLFYAFAFILAFGFFGPGA